MIKLKLCGMRRPEDIAMVNRHQPDMIGFIFVPRRRRTITLSEATALKEKLDPAVKAVGVFADAALDAILAAIDARVIDAVQLHGSEDDATIRDLKTRTDVPVIKAFSVKGSADIARANGSAADFVLLDCGPGGTGEAFDWRLLSGMTRPYFLAGGITPDNIDQALALNPYAVDISSGTETDGVKDEAKIAACVDAVAHFNL